MREEKSNVPKSESLTKLVNDNWRQIHERLYDELPYDTEIRMLEKAIQLRESRIKSGDLDTKFDWEDDFNVPKFIHEFNLDWRIYHEETRNRYRKYWENLIEQQRSTVKEISFNGLKTILLVHGAVALGALNILGSQRGNQSLQAGAKIALLSAIVGIILVGSGQFVVAVRMAEITNRIQGWIATKTKWRRMIALGRYTRRYLAILKYANWAIYASMLWFCLYAIIVYIVIVS